ncbi:MAG TPA: DUF5012 domain-containing protein [Saprospiraceae bacterium]|nr:DUF5012 domain-containing protein [Saprospiraceae bacterium]
MKQIYFAVIAGLLSVSLSSCDSVVNSAEASEITYLPKLTMNGSSEIDLGCNPSGGYTDEGLIAEEQGKEIPVTTVITGKYFDAGAINGPDIYSISYSAANKDGIPGAAERTVIWQECQGDFVNSIAGMYSSVVVRNGVSSAQYTDLGPIIIKDLGSGVYQLSDAIGGYYDFGRGYGYTYAARGMKVTANDLATNSFTHTGTVEVGDFGGALIMKDFKIDPATKTIKFTTDWDAGFVFEVTLTQL